MEPKRYSRFREFYPFYLAEHSRRGTRVLHFFGTGAGLICLALAIGYGAPSWILLGLGLGYGFAWLSHAFIERNRPATFRHPFYSFLADLRLFLELLSGRRRF